ncbi:MAG: hypothetical protein RJA44_1047, partial [Pseudomonadota bacterium]
MNWSYATAVPAAEPVVRLERLDALRGLAMLWMALFHFCFDLSHYGLLAGQNFYRDPFWLLQRLCIVSLFLACAGAGQVLALQAAGGQRWSARFWRRWAQVAACALLVSLGSVWMFPRSYISFGVLHAVAVMLLLLRLLAPLGRMPLLLLALMALPLPLLLADPWFDSRWTNWIGLTTHKPITEDYVPLLPWFGVMALGWLLADLLRR